MSCTSACLAGPALARHDCAVQRSPARRPARARDERRLWRHVSCIPGLQPRPHPAAQRPAVQPGAADPGLATWGGAASLASLTCVLTASRLIPTHKCVGRFLARCFVLVTGCRRVRDGVVFVWLILRLDDALRPRYVLCFPKTLAVLRSRRCGC